VLNKGVLALTSVAMFVVMLAALVPVYRSNRLDHEVRTAQSSVRHAAVAAEAFAQRFGNFDGIKPASLKSLDSAFSYVGRDTPASGQRSASVVGQGQRFAAAAYGNAKCYWIEVDSFNGNFVLNYASARSSLRECVAGRYDQADFTRSATEGWKKPS
jgi:hypothetical protein